MYVKINLTRFITTKQSNLRFKSLIKHLKASLLLILIVPFPSHDISTVNDSQDFVPYDTFYRDYIEDNILMSRDPYSILELLWHMIRYCLPYSPNAKNLKFWKFKCEDQFVCVQAAICGVDTNVFTTHHDINEKIDWHRLQEIDKCDSKICSFLWPKHKILPDEYKEAYPTKLEHFSTPWKLVPRSFRGCLNIHPHLSMKIWKKPQNNATHFFGVQIQLHSTAVYYTKESI